jgi:hypothetical protein
VENFIVSYLNFCNEIIYNDLYLFGLITESDFIYDVQTVGQILTTQTVDLHPELEYPLSRFYYLANLSFNIKFNNINNHLKNLFMKNIPKNLKNISLIHLSRTYDDNNQNIEPLAEVITKNAELILIQMNNFETKFNKISSYYLKTKNIIDRKIVLTKYFEHCFVRPVFIIFNQFVLNMNFIRGSECFTIYKLLFNLLKCINFFYLNINKREDISNLLNENAKAETKSFERKLLQGVEILDFESISVKLEMDIDVLEEILEESRKISKNEIKYFEIEKLYKILISSVTKILRVLPEENEDSDREFQDMKFSSYARSAVTKTKTDKIIKKPLCIQRLEKLITKYESKLVATYDKNLALIKVLELSEGDYEHDIGVNLYSYLLSKFSDTLTNENYYTIKNYKKGDIANISIENFKFQNVYTLIYLNALFYNDSSRFQSILEENIGENYEIFFNFLTINLIFPSICSEVVKLYEIERFHHIGNPSFAYEIPRISIKLLQNLCESHNQTFQDKFYSFKYNVELSEYTTKDYFSTYDKDKDPERDKDVDKNYFSKVKDGIIKNIRESRRDVKRDIMLLEKLEDEMLKRGDSTTIARLSDKKMTKKVSVVQRPLMQGDEVLQSHKEHFDKRKQKEIQELQNLEERKLTFFNFVGHNMRMLISNLNLENESHNTLLRLNRQIKNYDHILELYQRFSDLIVEMLQGTKCSNYDNFYKKLPDSLQVFDENGHISNSETLDSFVFINKCIEIKSFLFESKDIFDKISIQMKFNAFFTINNLINQEMVDISIVKIFIAIFPPDKLIDLISKYLRGLFICHVYRVKYNDEKFFEQFDDLELNREIYATLIRRFKDSSNIYDDDFFKLASQMYLFLTILGEKYKIPEAERLIKLNKKELIYNPEDDQEVNTNKGFFSIFNPFAQKSKKLVNKKKKTKYQINNLIITSTFFNKIIHSCEFMIDSSNDEGDELNLKKLYFIIDPRVYLISRNNIDIFLDEVDRSSSTTKLKSLIDVLNSFLNEVEYKNSIQKKSTSLKWMMDVDYKDMDFMNFIFSLGINIFLLIFLRSDSFESGFVYYIVSLVALIQIFINFIYLIIFWISKYRFYVMVEKKNYTRKSLTLTEWFKVNVFNSFLLNDEIYLLILNILIGVIGIISTHTTFIFSLQLFTVIKFVPTIKEIVIAFKLRFSQLISMIGFLAILIFFYSNIGFYFFPQEFVKELDNGSQENICQTMLECSITYFNLGVRSGGGIGDLLDMKPFRESYIYWLRWVTDMIFYITVILLLLNMINGVIVSTFSQIREESNEKDEDIKNKCFICNIDRVEFEKRKIPFSDHQKYEHNTKTYIRFLIYLKITNEKDLDADQSFIIQCLKERDISCFPVLRSFSVGNLQKQDDDGGDDEGDDE